MKKSKQIKDRFIRELEMNSKEKISHASFEGTHFSAADFALQGAGERIQTFRLIVIEQPAKK